MKQTCLGALKWAQPSSKEGTDGLFYTYGVSSQVVVSFGFQTGTIYSYNISWNETTFLKPYGVCSARVCVSTQEAQFTIPLIFDEAAQQAGQRGASAQNRHLSVTAACVKLLRSSPLLFARLLRLAVVSSLLANNTLPVPLHVKNPSVRSIHPRSGVLLH